MLLRLLLILSLMFSAVGLGAIGFQLLAPVSAPRAAAPPPPPPLPPPLASRILVANRPLPAGTLLKDEDFRIAELPAAQVPQGALAPSDETRAELRGALLRRYVEPGEAVGRADVLRARDRGFLAAVLRPAMRAISVGVDVVTG